MNTVKQSTLMELVEQLGGRARSDQGVFNRKLSSWYLEDCDGCTGNNVAQRNISESLKLRTEESMRDEADAKDASTDRILAGTAPELGKQSGCPVEKQVPGDRGQEAYSQTRRSGRPRIQKLKANLNRDQQIVMNKRCFRTGPTAFSDINPNGVFLADANRIRSITSTKLYMGLCSDTAEDPVLWQAKTEEVGRLANERALSEQTHWLLRSMEAAQFDVMSRARKEAALAETEAKKRAEGGETETDRDVRTAKRATLDGGASVEGNTASSSVAFAPSASLSLVIPGTGAGTGVTRKHSANVTPALNSKGNNVQFARMGSMKSVRSTCASDDFGYFDSEKFCCPGLFQALTSEGKPVRTTELHPGHITSTVASAGAGTADRTAGDVEATPETRAVSATNVDKVKASVLSATRGRVATVPALVAARTVMGSRSASGSATVDLRTSMIPDVALGLRVSAASRGKTLSR
jgi:glucokinase